MLVGFLSVDSKASRALCKFRKLVVVVLAVNRLRHLIRLCSGAQLGVMESTIGIHYKFAFAQANTTRKRGFMHAVDNVFFKFILSVILAFSNESEDFGFRKKLAAWFTLNSQTQTLQEIGSDLNRHLYKSRSCM